MEEKLDNFIKEVFGNKKSCKIIKKENVNILLFYREDNTLQENFVVSGIMDNEYVFKIIGNCCCPEIARTKDFKTFCDKVKEWSLFAV